MRHILTLALLAAAVAPTGGRADTNDPAQPPRGPAPVTADLPAGAARLTALVVSGGFVARQRNVLSVTNPGTGRYCVRPSPGAGIADVGRVTPSATVDWSTSTTDGSLVQYRSSGYGCPSGTIEFVTFAQDPRTGQFVRSDDVGFSVVVP